MVVTRQRTADSTRERNKVENANKNREQLLKNAEVNNQTTTAYNTGTKTYVSADPFGAIMSLIVLVVLSFMLLLILQLYAKRYFPKLKIECDIRKAAWHSFMLVLLIFVYSFWRLIVKAKRAYSDMKSSFRNLHRQWVLYLSAISVPVFTLVSLYKNAPEGEFFTMIRT